MVPLFGAVPGAPELLIILLMLLLMLGIPIAIAVGLFLLGRWSGSRGGDASAERLAALQKRVEELEAQLDGERGTDSTSEFDTGTDDTD